MCEGNLVVTPLDYIMGNDWVIHLMILYMILIAWYRVGSYLYHKGGKDGS